MPLDVLNCAGGLPGGASGDGCTALDCAPVVGCAATDVVEGAVKVRVGEDLTPLVEVAGGTAKESR